MSYLVGGLVIILFWAILYRYRSSLQPSLQQSSSSLSSTSLEISRLSLHVSTTSFNHLPRRLLRPFTTKNGKTRLLPLYWDVGAVTVILGLLLAQLILAVAASKGAYALTTTLYSIWSSETQQVVDTLPRLIKRTLVKRLVPSDSLLITPIIPGLTHSLSSLPLLLFALFSSQVFHELGHACAAASESISTVSTGFRLHLFIPTFYVSLPAHSSSPSTDLRIAAGGIWHNILLVTFTYLISSQGLGAGSLLTRVFYEKVEGGLFIDNVDSSSPLYHLLATRSIITHLDDLELDSSSSPTDLWADYLSNPPSSSSTYSSLGWCLPDTSFSNNQQSIPLCCQPDHVESVTHELCFRQSSTPTQFSYGCLDPTDLFSPRKSENTAATRCLNDQDCNGGKKCTTLTDGEKIIRIRVSDADEEASDAVRTIVYQGSRLGVLRQVSVSPYRPKSNLIPLLYLRTMERLYSHLLSLSLALAFFNLLPLPHLDGQHLLHSLCRAILSSPSLALEEGLGIQSPSFGNDFDGNGGLLEGFLHWLRNWKLIRGLAEESEDLIRFLNLVTIRLGLITVMTGVGVVFLGRFIQS